MEDVKDIPKLSYDSPCEGLAEKFHMREDLLSALNPGRHFGRAGEAILVIDSRAKQTSEKAAKVEVNKSRQTAKLFDKSNALIGFHPATIGSEEKPFPSGTLNGDGDRSHPDLPLQSGLPFSGVHSLKPFTIKLRGPRHADPGRSFQSE
ncbi:hypothetical protein IVB06_30995 [Bradyrhizobium sp. 171]|uniref:hypothetical protein n=1 Tax=Bradyrhizobium sp. 176 TaxID=2782646 RepID=UPI001FFB72D6|nr:hypothetical protein [Bradyrhizobium sp. 176]MCK1538019.1 hypothetical protein [Bradyrhizobium sp. 176]MCK1560640.1 hypothetical protein [Bradyrhizobium sp. 171]